MHFLLKMGDIPAIDMLIYQRVLGGSSHLVSGLDHPHLQAMKQPFVRGPTTPGLGDYAMLLIYPSTRQVNWDCLEGFGQSRLPGSFFGVGRCSALE